MGRHTRSRKPRRTRISRPLIGALGIAIAVGGGYYFYHHFGGRVFSHHPSGTPVAAQHSKDDLSLMAIAPVAPDANAVGHDSAMVLPGPTLAEVLPTAATPAVLVTQTPVGPTTAPAAVPVTAPGTPATRPAQAKAAPPATSAAVGVHVASAPVKPAPPAAAPPARPVAPAAPPAVLASAVLPSAQPLVDAKAKFDAGELLEARGILNAALVGGHLSTADAASARHLMGEVSQKVFFSTTKIKDDPFQTLYRVQSGDRLARIADHHGITWELLCRINGLSDPRKLRSGQWIKIPTGPFHCIISKKDYRLDLYLGSPGEAGSLLVTSFPVGLGKDNSTPVGTWVLQQNGKVHPATYYSPRGEGVIAADDPKNPLGGYWMGLTGVAGNAVDKASYGIHGTIEPDSIGKQASMGCIRLGHDDIAFLYELLVEGKSKVVVKE